jgi:hypothetical protein
VRLRHLRDRAPDHRPRLDLNRNRNTGEPMLMLQVTSDATERVWDPSTRTYRDAAANLSGSIPAPIAARALTAPSMIKVGDQVMVHAMGTWYPATVMAIRPKSGKLEVEYSSGTGATRRKQMQREHLVPPGCGYQRRQDGMLAEQWAAAVWRTLTAFVSPPPKARDELVTVQEATPAAAGEPIPDDDEYEGSWREAADNEGARIAAADRED